MKKVNIFIIISGILIYLISFACIDDKGNYSYLDENQVMPLQISGLQDTSCILFSSLTIKPEIEGMTDKDNYQFVWFTYPATAAGFLPIRDTISKEETLENYEIKLESGSYRLVFEIIDKQTGLIYSTNVALNVVSTLSEGWYVLKDQNELTDIDFILPDGTIQTDIIFNITGEKLIGTAVKCLYQESRYYHQVTDIDGTVSTLSNLKVLHVLSSEDMKTLNGDNMSIYKNYEEIFYDLPEIRKPQNVAFYSSTALFIMVGYKIHGLYTMSTNLGIVGIPPVGDYILHSDMLMNNFSGVMVYDTFNKKFQAAIATNSTLSNFSEQSDTEAELQLSPSDVGMEMINLLQRSVGSPSTAFALMKDLEEEKYFMLDVVYERAMDYPFKFIYTIPDDNLLPYSSAKAAHQVSSYIYFGIDNKLYHHFVTPIDDSELLDSREKLLYTFAENETISYITHVKNTSANINSLIVLTNDSHNWKMYRFEMIGDTAEFNTTPLETYSGEGNARYIMYRKG